MSGRANENTAFYGSYRTESRVLFSAPPRLAGKLTAAFFALGDYDTVALVEMPDNVSATAFSMAAAAAGGVKAVKTTPLMTTEESLTAMKKAADCGYRPPS